MMVNTRIDPLLSPGEEYMLFLREWEPGKYFVLGGPQGRYRITDGRVYSMNRVADVTILPLSLDVDGWQKADFIKHVMK